MSSLLGGKSKRWIFIISSESSDHLSVSFLGVLTNQVIRVDWVPLITLVTSTKPASATGEIQTVFLETGVVEVALGLD